MSMNKLAVLVLGAAMAFSASAAKVIVGDTGGPTAPTGRALQVFKERAEKYSNGELQVEIYSNSQLGTFGTMATQMKVNVVNVMFIQPDALGQQIPIVTANSWPFLFRNQDEMLKAWNGPGGKALTAEVEKRSGYRMMAFSWNVPRWIYSTRDARSLADLKGMKIRVPGTAIYVEQLKLLGLASTPMNIAETFTAMQQGVVEGIEGAITDMTTYSIQDVAKSAVMTGHVLSPKAFLTYGRFVDGLGKSKDAFVRAAQDGSDSYSETTKADEKAMIEMFKSKGVKFVEPQVPLEQMRQMTEPLKKQLPEVWQWAQRLASGK